jgi:hypothetical protein
MLETMKLNRKNILDKTHHGITIIAFVLRQFYPQANVLSLSGRTAGITRNPFNSDKETLSVKIKKDIAVFSDHELKEFTGDAFDFAQLYFNSNSEDDLLLQINKALELHLDEEIKNDLAWLDDPDDSWKPVCSFFKAPVRNVFPTESLKLFEIYNLIKGETYKSLTSELRAIKDIKEKRKFKANRLDYVTFSGGFSRRNDQNLENHSGLITIDFDHIEDIEDLKTQLLSDAYFDTEMLFISPSGDGLKWIIGIDLNKATHAEYFLAISNYLKLTYKIDVDASGKDISRACFLPHDADVFLHNRHMPL